MPLLSHTPYQPVFPHIVRLYYDIRADNVQCQFSQKVKKLQKNINDRFTPSSYMKIILENEQGVSYVNKIKVTTKLFHVKQF